MWKEISKGAVFSCRDAVSHHRGAEAMRGSHLQRTIYQNRWGSLIYFCLLSYTKSTAIWNKDKAAITGRQNLSWETVWGWSNSQMSCGCTIGTNCLSFIEKQIENTEISISMSLIVCFPRKMSVAKCENWPRWQSLVDRAAFLCGRTDKGLCSWNTIVCKNVLVGDFSVWRAELCGMLDAVRSCQLSQQRLARAL